MSFYPTPAEIAYLTALELNANQHTAVKYAGVLAGLIALCSIAYITRSLWHRLESKGPFTRVLATPSRIVRRVALLKVKGFTSVGHATTVGVYLVINIVLAVTNVNFEWPWSFFALRCGWMAVMNLALTFFLALKNTPLAPLVGLSYEKLNVLHRWAGRTTFVFACLHMSITIAEYSATDQLFHLRLKQEIHGQIAFACLTLLVIFSIAIIRTNFYEVFYKIHIFLYLMIVINIGMHQPVLAVRVVPVVSTLGTLWCIDRLIRTVRMLYYSQGNTVSLIPLPNGSTRVVFKRHINCDPGSHAFVWIPAIRAFETHPFTIASATNTEFVVRKQTGFTADLHEYAQKHPNGELRAFFDGPYGTVPNFHAFEKVVLLAGGSGASFTFAVALDFITQTKNKRTKAIEFVWVVKEESNLAWFQTELSKLRQSALINVTIHVTSQNVRVQRTEHQGADLTIDNPLKNEGEKEMSNTGPTALSSDNLEKGIDAAVSMSASTTSLDLQPGRPDIQAIISQVIRSASADEAIIVAACGPKKMMVDARNAVAGLTRINGPSITIHTEQFGWA